ncbi:tRNA (adenosine(37)-N6)-dimethylallyltransferase MiaA [Brevibacillus agri]|uniref:tRNA (adenosine(37)-N6)-dimethylallyltransferase MiaA n=1 Tax=Brevibacillus TaxID=55080 RepID=UPI0002A516AD|nr:MULTISPECIES: tRNA (adenosine(37)-N6)-dimethylallyltransferase MiaA [Brevibacillus]ELK39562.1 tRNA delta(2)-isopentenylpyrophosphate transferase [Brevibacillus agri BAB-2500]MBG9565790.1 tRNA delta(2)-isopentenylpyrophosphate transferase [Brevibacillus agri]MBY0053620.1 tRNA (adenosine(37)-N6)-dimethylallyltransferase MiaA [Brevibacillus agri]MED1645119.1 tRNA (adenosine(37)-N6)-dimethylallyltransferase MiaA [Brevibacillus agri]MED1654111.1 tRNA (adenosine(37)-N6)-dimethylallyltransferase M
MTLQQKEKLVVIIGPTAVGKTQLSLDLAQQFNGEIISGDSMQVYRGMDIGTAKAEPAELALVPHHLIDIKNPDEEYSVALFQESATRLITEINQRERLPFIVGGTGLYIESVTHRFQFSQAAQDPELRERLQRLADAEGVEALHARLADVDPITAQRLHPNDVKRVIRALEIYESTGYKMSDFQLRAQHSPYDLVMIGLTMERAVLYERINRRVELMIEEGLVEEVRGLLDKGYDASMVSMQGLGYKELIPYLYGEITLEKAINDIQQRTRHFAKRQLSWFRRIPEVQWFDMTDPAGQAKSVETIKQILAGKFQQLPNI